MKICKFEGCGRKHQSLGFCDTHYQQLRKTGETWEIGNRKRKKRICKFEGCENIHRAGGFCHSHYRQMRETGKTWVIGSKQEKRICKFKGCDRFCVGSELCDAHYRQLRKTGKLMEINYRTRKLGETFVNNGGYIVEKIGLGKKGWVLQHRLFMEKKIGRPLEKHETVHHKNTIRDDNRIENLEIRHLSDHPPGGSLDDMMRYWLEKIRKYGPLYGYGVHETKGPKIFDLDE